MGYNIGPKIGIDGEKEFRDSIKKINDTYKALEAETKAVTTAFEANGDEQGKLEATAKQLQKQIDLQKEKMGLLQDAVQKATDKYGENSIEATRLRGAMYDAQAGASKLEAELKDVNSRLDGSEDAMEQFGAAVDDAGDKALSFGDVLKANVISDVIMDGIRELGSCFKEFIGGSIEEAASMQAITAQVEQTFGTMGEVAGDALENISDEVKIASTRMQGSFTKIYAFAKTSGASAENALNIASRAIVAAADSAAYYDRSIEDATETIQAFIKGNFANDAALGIACTETTRNTKANELYAKSFKDLTEAQKVDTLLAMVEAGNAASGAIGQAARESDGWENVTGELAEVMRLLQVEAGKPALKKLVPIIKKITEAGYELIDDIDWDEFAEKVEDLADGVIEHGPMVVRMIASITAAIVAVKAVKKAQEIAGIAKSFLSIGTAAKTTAQTVATTGAIAAATPWGAVAAIIGGAAALITAFCTSAKTDAQALSDSMDTFKARMEDANADFEETRGEIEGNAYAAEVYVQRLEELEEAGLNTAVAHKEYEMVVEQLNELMPELNLTINEQTGLLDQSTESIRSNIEAMKESAIQQAMQDRFTDMLKAQGKAQAEILEAQVKLNRLEKETEKLKEAHIKAYEDLEEAQKRAQEAQEAYTKAAAKGGEVDRDLRKAYDETQIELSRKIDAYRAAEEEIGVYEMEIESLSYVIDEGNKTIASYSEEIELAQEMYTALAEQTSGLTAEQVELNQKIEDTQSALDSVNDAYAQAMAGAQESIGKQIDLFGDLAEESDYSAEKVIANWQSQRQAMLNYAENLKKAKEMGLSYELIAQLSDGSEESMAILQQWASGTEADIAKINNEFSKLMDGKQVVAETVTEINYGFKEQFQEVYDAAEEAGLQIVDGVVVGIEENTAKLEESMAKLGGKAVTAFNRRLMIRSPAKKMIPSGRFVVEGAVEGVDENVRQFEASMERLALAGQNAFDQERMERAANYPVQLSPASTTQQTRVDHNYGGISIQIYPREGQDAEAIANEVFDRLQHVVEREEAAL